MNSQIRKRARTSLVVVMTLALVLWAPAVALGPAVGGAAAQQEGDQPQTPASYYGNVTIDGDPAPAGTVIEAEINDTVVGSIAINESGEYAEPGPLGEKLLVGGNQSIVGGIDNGSEVSFFVNNDEIDRTEVGTTDPETVEWSSGDNRRVDLAASIDEPLLTLNVTNAPANVTAGNNIAISANITNTGAANATERTINVSVNGTVRQQLTVSPAVGRSTERTAQVPTNSTDAGNVTVTVDTGDRTASRTVEVERPPDFAVTSLSLNETSVNATEAVAVTATVTNRGDQAGTQNLTFRAGAPDVSAADREAFDDAALELDAGESASRSVTLRTDSDDVGTQIVTAATADDTNSSVLSVAAGATFAVNVIESESKLDVVAGETATIVAEVENTGGSAGTRTVNVTRDDTDTELTSRDIELDPGEIADINASATTSAAGTLNLTVNAAADDSETELVNVTEAQDASFDVTIDDTNSSVDEPLPGNTTNISVDVNVTNLGGDNGIQTIEFRVNGDVEETEEVVLAESGGDPDSDELTDVRLPVEPGQTPSVDVAVASENDTATRTVDVNTTAAFDVEIVERSNRSQTTTAEPFAPTINVTNVGGQDGDGLLQVRFNGSAPTNFSVDGLAPGAEREVVNDTNIALNASSEGLQVVEAGIVNNGTGATDDTATRKVPVGEAPNFTVESVTLTRDSDVVSEVAQNDEVTVDARINNTGDAAGTNRTVTIDFDGREIDARVIDELDPGNTTTLTAMFSTLPEEVTPPGESARDVTVSTADDETTASLRVLEPAVFEVTAVSATESVIAGDAASVDVTVENAGGRAGNTTDVRVIAEGDEVTNQIELDAGETRVVEFDDAIATSEAGDLGVTAATDDDFGTDTIAVGEPGDLDFELISLTDTVTNASTLSATVRATNVGDGAATETLALRLEQPNGNTPEVDSITVGPIDGGNDTVVTLSENLDRDLDDEDVNAAVAISGADEDDRIDKTVTIEQPPEAPDFRVSDLSAPASVLETEETVNVTASVTNVGDNTTAQDIELSVGGEVRDTNASLRLDGDESASIDLAFNASNVNTGTVEYAIASENESTGSNITVENAAPGTAEIAATEVLTDDVTQGESLQLNATVENTGDLNATNETVALNYTAADAVSDLVEIDTLQPGATRTVMLSIVPPTEPRAGTFDRDIRITSNDTTVTRTLAVDFEDIQSGIAAADEGDTVEVAAGTFEPRNEITIGTDELTLTAADASSRPLIESPRQADTTVVVEAAGVTLSNLRVRGASGPGVVLDWNNTTVRNVQVRNAAVGIDETNGTNRIVGSSVFGSDRGIVLAGDSDTAVEFTRVAGATRQGIVVRSPGTELRGIGVSGSAIGVDVESVAGTDITDSTISGNDNVGLRVVDVEASDSNPSATVETSALDANGVGALIANTTVNTSQNWWGTPSPEENSEYLVRSGLNLDPSTSRPGAEFNVSVDAPGETARGSSTTVSVTVTNNGTQTDLQTIELLANGTAVNSTNVEIDGRDDTTIDLSYTPTIADDDEVGFTARSRDETSNLTTTTVQSPASLGINSSGIPDSITEGNTLTVTPTIENTGGISGTQTVRLLVDGTEVDNASITVDGDSSDSAELKRTPDADAGVTLNVTVAIDGASTSADVSVNADESEEEEESNTGSTGGSDTDDDDVPDPVEEIGEPTNVESVAPEVDTDAGQAVATFEGAENVEEVALDTTEDVGEVTVSDLDPETADTEPAPGDSVALQDISVPDEAADTAATIEFRVSNDRLDATGTDAENLRAFRLVDGDWQRLETSVAEETDGGVVLEAQTPGFSVFAVSAVTPPEGSIALDPETATVDEDVSLSGAESTDPDGEVVSYEWSVDGETLTGETVTVSFDEAGEYTVELAVTDDAGETDTVTRTLVIEAADTATATPEPDTATATPEPDTGTPTSTPGFGVVVALIALLFGAGYAARRQRE